MARIEYSDPAKASDRTRAIDAQRDCLRRPFRIEFCQRAVGRAHITVQLLAAIAADVVDARDHAYAVDTVRSRFGCSRYIDGCDRPVRGSYEAVKVAMTIAEVARDHPFTIDAPRISTAFVF